MADQHLTKYIIQTTLSGVISMKLYKDRLLCRSIYINQFSLDCIPNCRNYTAVAAVDMLSLLGNALDHVYFQCTLWK